MATKERLGSPAASDAGALMKEGISPGSLATVIADFINSVLRCILQATFDELVMNRSELDAGKGHRAREINARRSRLGAKAKLSDLPLGSRALAEVERETIRQTLKEAYTDRTAAAKALGIAVSTLYEKIKKYGL